MQYLTSLFSDRLLYVGIAAAVVVVLILLILILRLAFGRRVRAPGGRQRPVRLGLVDAFELDRNRQLVLVRRDNVEHLIMIGGPNDVLIESEIVRSQSLAAAPAATSGNAPHLRAPTSLSDILGIESAQPQVAPVPAVPAPASPVPVAIAAPAPLTAPAPVAPVQVAPAPVSAAPVAASPAASAPETADRPRVTAAPPPVPLRPAASRQPRFLQPRTPLVARPAPPPPPPPPAAWPADEPEGKGAVEPDELGKGDVDANLAESRGTVPPPPPDGKRAEVRTAPTPVVTPLAVTADPGSAPPVAPAPPPPAVKGSPKSQAALDSLEDEMAKLLGRSGPVSRKG